MTSTMTPVTPPLGRARVLARGLCVAAIAGLALSSVPTSATASAPVAQSPLLPRTVVGLSQGSTGSDVVALQNALLAAGVTVPGGADGVFGPKTKSALTAFQSRSDLATTGRVDPATATALGLSGPAPAPETGALAIGARGDAVKALQRALMSLGVFVPGGADGFFGPATKTALSNFQRWNELTVTGVADAATSSKLGLGGGPSAPAAVSGPAATPAGTATFVGMKSGVRGDNVKVLQRALINAGVSVRGGADGWFGPATEAALVRYQRANGLSATGVVDGTIVEKLGLSAGASTPAPAPAPAPAPSPSARYVGLSVGDRGDLVKDLQRALMDTGLTLRGGADGVFGNMTRATLILFQGTNGTTKNGVVSAKDASVLGLGTSSGPQGIANTGGFAVFGERGARVESLQRSLIRVGISFVGGADGVFGSATAGAVIAFQRREGLPATGRVDATTAARLGTAEAPAPPRPTADGVNIDVFPVQGRCWYGDTWHAPRSGGRLHQGVDIIAPTGKLLYAVTDGTISKIYIDRPGALAGNGLRLTEDNGTYYTYLHLDRFAEGIEVGTKVEAGQVIGYVGNTGSSGTPHLHFEVHPG